MPAPDLIQQQREILRNFRKAIIQRTETEVIAETKYKAEKEVANKILNDCRLVRANSEKQAKEQLDFELENAKSENVRIQTTAATILGDVEREWKRAHSALATLGMEKLLEQRVNISALPDDDQDPLNSLTEVRTQFDATVQQVRYVVQELQNWREARTTRRRILIGALYGVLIILLIYIFSQGFWG